MIDESRHSHGSFAQPSTARPSSKSFSCSTEDLLCIFILKERWLDIVLFSNCLLPPECEAYCSPQEAIGGFLSIVSRASILLRSHAATHAIFSESILAGLQESIPQLPRCVRCRTGRIFKGFHCTITSASPQEASFLHITDHTQQQQHRILLSIHYDDRTSSIMPGSAARPYADRRRDYRYLA